MSTQFEPLHHAGMAITARETEMVGPSQERLEAVRDVVKGLIDLWVPRMRLQGWRFILNWDRGEGSEQLTGVTNFEVEADWRYMTARIKVYLGTIHDEPTDELARSIVHELVHVHLAEIRLGDDSNHAAHEERVTESLSRVILEAYEGHWTVKTPDE